MDHNELTMFMDVKIDLVDKRPEVAYFRHWNCCQVKIEAVKCLPCFLRITLESREESYSKKVVEEQRQKLKTLTISINVPGVVITLASSRTKKHSYAVSWMQNRKTCCIYLSLDNELSCRRHMKWLRKSIKNLELHRKLMLEERRTSQLGVGNMGALGPLPLLPDNFDESDRFWTQRVSEIYEEILEENLEESQQHRLSRRCSSTSIASGIYEEMKPPFNASHIFESIREEMPSIPSTPPPLPPFPPQRKRFNTYEAEETAPIMPLSMSNEIPRSNTNPETEMAKKKKYKNVLENFFYGGGSRSKRTASVSDSSSSKEQLNDNGGGEVTPKAAKPKFVEVQSMEETKFSDLASKPPSTSPQNLDSLPPIYANDDAATAVAVAVAAAAAQRPKKPPPNVDDAFERYANKRNSFSSPDLSKINFIDTFDEQRIAELLGNSYSKCDELDLVNSVSLDETGFMLLKAAANNDAKKTSTKPPAAVKSVKNYALTDQNISQQIPNNFNFSACNTSAINLIAPLSSLSSSSFQPPPINDQNRKNKIIFDDLSGYCVMAPIVKKMSAIDNTLPLPLAIQTSKRTTPCQAVESISSGYSTSSHCSSTSSRTNSTDDRNHPSKPEEEEEERTQPTIIQEESVVYENMLEPMPIDNKTAQWHHSPKHNATMQLDAADFTGNLYENLLAIKAAQELEPKPIINSSTITTSTPADSPLLESVATPDNNSGNVLLNVEEEENYYQTPRKSIISIDEKIPSYYPNTCESSVKSRRRSYSPARVNNKMLSQEKTPTTSKTEKTPLTTAYSTTPILKHFMSTRLRNERKENIYLTSPQGLVEQRLKSSKTHNSIPNKNNINLKNAKTKKTAAAAAAAHKISENVYSVKHCISKHSTKGSQSTSSNNNTEKNTDPFHDTDENDIELVKDEDNKATNEFLHLAVLQNIDFKFESSNLVAESQISAAEIEENEQKKVLKNITSHQHNTNNKKLQEISSNEHSSMMTTTTNSTTTAAATATVAAPMSQSIAIANNENMECAENHSISGIKKFASLPRFKKFNLSPLRTRINNVLQRNHTPDL